MGRRWAGVWIVGLACCCGSCDSFNLGSVAGLLTGNGVTIEVHNETGLAAAPDIRLGSSRNVLEDLLTESEPAANFGIVGANQVASSVLTCDGELERIVVGGAEFRDAAGLPLGDTSDTKTLRRDVDFDCGDVIVIRLTGRVFNFRATVSVQRAAGGGTGFFESGGGIDETGNDDVADFLDDLFGS